MKMTKKSPGETVNSFDDFASQVDWLLSGSLLENDDDDRANHDTSSLASKAGKKDN